jgi:predicted N-acetyltransferase YhbS
MTDLSMSLPQPNPAVQLRTMTPADLPAAHALSQAVSWPHRLDDWRFVLRVGHGLIAVAGDRVIGTAMWWRQGASLTRLGMIIVDPTLQRAGVGRALMDAMLANVDTPVSMLTATVAGRPLYLRLGFTDAGTISQHQGQPGSSALPRLATGTRLRPVVPDDLPILAVLDAVATGADRSVVLRALFEVADVVVLERSGSVLGFSARRPFGRGHVIGPVIAGDQADAGALIDHWLAAFAEQFVRIDVPGHSMLSPWLVDRGLPSVDTGHVMVRGAAPVAAGNSRMFGLINPALG